MIPHKKMKRNSKVKAEWGPVDFGDGFHLRIRLMDFELLNKEGEPYTRSNCLSLQVGNQENRYIAFISFPAQKLRDVIAKLSEVEASLSG